MSLNINIKIMKKPELSDEEIRSHMNFDNLMQAYKTHSVPRSPKWLTISGYVALGVFTISAITYFSISRESQEIKNRSGIPKISHPDSSTRVNKVIEVQEKPAEKKQEVKSMASLPATPKKTQLKTSESAAEKKTISQFTEAAPVDGYPALYSYFDKELKYPVAAKDSIEGIVTVSFAINVQGKPDHIKIENSLGDLFDKECTRVIENMPIWNPATINGKPVSARLSIPLTFKIKK